MNRFCALLVAFFGTAMPALAAEPTGPAGYGIVSTLVVAGAIALPLLLVLVLRERRLQELADLRARLDRRERVLEMVVDTVSSGIVAFDAHGQIETMNEAARRMLGLGPEDRDTVTWPASAQFKPTEEGSSSLPPVWAMLMGKRIRGGDYLLEVEGRSEPRRVRVNAEPAPMGGPVGAVMTIEDVTEQHRARVLADRAERLDALGKLTGGVAHDFNNLLSTIMGAVQLAQRQAGEDAKLARHLAIALRATRTGADLVERLLGFAKRGSGQNESVSVAAIIDEVRPLAGNMIGPSVDFEFAPCDPAMAVHCDRAQIVTALLNLFANARDAIEAAARPGKIGVSACQDPRQEGFAVIAVTDNGTGMSPEVMTRALDPFFTTKGAARGTGLGLSMVYGALRRCGGDMRIRSTVGEGTTVQLLLPLVATASTKADAAPPAATVGKGAGRAVLLVEDEPDLLDIAEAMLGDLGYAVIRAANAAEALHELASGRVIDILVTDLMMPGGMDGLELAMTVRAQRPSMPVVIVSGVIEDMGAVNGLENVALVRKPYSIEALSAALGAARAAFGKTPQACPLPGSAAKTGPIQARDELRQTMARR